MGRPSRDGVIILTPTNRGRIDPAEVHQIEGVDRIRTGAVAYIIAVVSQYRPLFAPALHQCPPHHVGTTIIDILLYAINILIIGISPPALAVSETQQMADFMGVYADAGELVNVVVVGPPALALAHDIAVAYESRHACPMPCNLIHLRVQQTCGISSGIGGPGIQIEHLTTQATSSIVRVIGEVIDGVSCDRRPAGKRRRRVYTRTPAAHRIPGRRIRVVPEQVTQCSATPYPSWIPPLNLGIMGLRLRQFNPARESVGGRINHAHV